jgi:hypothetical protein
MVEPVILSKKLSSGFAQPSLRLPSATRKAFEAKVKYTF